MNNPSPAAMQACALSLQSFQDILSTLPDTPTDRLNFILYVLYCLSHPTLLKPEDTFHIYDAFKKLFATSHHQELKLEISSRLTIFYTCTSEQQSQESTDHSRSLAEQSFPIPHCSFDERKHYTLVSYAYLLCEGPKRSIKDSYACLNQALECHETSFAYFSRGRVAPSPEKKIRDYESSIRMDPSHSIAYNNVALQYENSMNKFDVALEYYNMAIQYHPYDFISYNNRALLYENRFNDRENALQDYAESIRLNNKYSTAWNNRGVCHKRMERYDLALHDYERAIAIDSSYENAIQNRQFLLTFLRRLSVIGNL